MRAKTPPPPPTPRRSALRFAAGLLVAGVFAAAASAQNDDIPPPQSRDLLPLQPPQNIQLPHKPQPGRISAFTPKANNVADFFFHWRPPANNGGAPVSQYIVTRWEKNPSIGGTGVAADPAQCGYSGYARIPASARTLSATAFSFTDADRPVGKCHTWSIEAVNAAGAGPALFIDSIL